MDGQRSHVILLATGVVLTLIGFVLLFIGLRGTQPAFANAGDDALSRSLMVMFGGGVSFAVGFMTLLAAIFRPLFERRPVDRAVDRLK